jgi:glyoxylase I family protein
MVDSDMSTAPDRSVRRRPAHRRKDAKMSTPASGSGPTGSAAEHSSAVTPHFRGVDHFSLTVTDLDASERFYTQVLGFLVVLDFGYGRLVIHKPTGFTIGLMRHAEATGTAFSELQTGLDHIGLTAGSRDELVAWEQRFDAFGVEFTPIRDMDLGHHLNFRDPDGIALEFFAPNEVYAAALRELRARDITDSEVREMAAQLGVAEYVAQR